MIFIGGSRAECFFHFGIFYCSVLFLFFFFFCSNTSMCGGVGEDEDEEPETAKEKLLEDDKMREKMKQLKLNMDRLNLEKKV